MSNKNNTATNKQKREEQRESGAESTVQIPLAELIENRYKKARLLQEKGADPYPYRYERSHAVGDIHSRFETLAEQKTVVRVAGRIMLKRKMGKVFFADLRDSTDKIQLYVKLDNVGREQFDLFDTIDLGDIMGCEGTLFVTRMGERTIAVSEFELLCKALHPLPDKHSGLQDIETRYRRRYADLIVNPDVRDTFVQRTRIVQAIRDFLNARGFLEVETPILQPIYGGGNALPFKTHHSKLDMTMYLRIADELYLKRLVVGGFDKVWEFCKDFRNEGMDRTHNPEFTMVELYWAFADYRDIAELTEDMFRHVVHRTHNTYRIPYGEHEIDFEPKFKWLSMPEAIAERTDLSVLHMSYEEIKAAARELGIADEGLINWGKCVEAIFEAKVEPTLIQPTFIADYPQEISPFAKKHRTDDRLTERFELFIVGSEFANAFSELNDPVDQLRRFLQQGRALEAGDAEAHPLDDDFITALAYGMPPTGGLGFGVDRMVMLLTNKHTIRDVIFFPQMKEMKEGSVPISSILSQLIADEAKE